MHSPLAPTSNLWRNEHRDLLLKPSLQLPPESLGSLDAGSMHHSPRNIPSGGRWHQSCWTLHWWWRKPSFPAVFCIWSMDRCDWHPRPNHQTYHKIKHPGVQPKIHAKTSCTHHASMSIQPAQGTQTHFHETKTSWHIFFIQTSSSYVFFRAPSQDIQNCQNLQSLLVQQTNRRFPPALASPCHFHHRLWRTLLSRCLYFSMVTGWRIIPILVSG